MPTKEFVVKGGSDADLWGDIDGPIDDAWAAAVNAMRQTSALAEFTAALHYGPGPHPDGSPQSVHAGGANPAAKPKPTFGQMAFDLDAAEKDDVQRFISAARAGRETTSRQIVGGITRCDLVTYEDGSQGVWKKLEYTGDQAEGHSGHAEVEAYRLSKLLGMDLVPPTVYSERAGVLGASQQFIPDLRTGKELEKEDRWREIDQDQFEDVQILDVLINNDDRNPGNWGIDGQGRLWAIDHGYAGFSRLATASVSSIAGTKGPRGPMGTSHLLSYVSASRMPTHGANANKKGQRANVAGWDQARVVAGLDLEDGKMVTVPLEQSGWLHGWQLPPAKLERLRQITQPQVDAAIIGPEPERWSQEERWGKVKRAANVWANLQALTKEGAFTWW